MNKRDIKASCGGTAEVGGHRNVTVWNVMFDGKLATGDMSREECHWSNRVKLYAHSTGINRSVLGNGIPRKITRRQRDHIKRTVLSSTGFGKYALAKDVGY